MSAELIGKTIMGYQVVQPVGAGAYGTVYRVVKQSPLGTYTRALKHISIPSEQQYWSVMESMGGDSAKAAEHFEQLMRGVVDEVRTLSSLSELGNAHIVRYYESDMTVRQNPRHYDVYVLMEFLAPFRRYEEQPESFTVRDVVRFALEVLDGIGFCHSHGIIHRDIKEGNIFVAESDVYKIGDFGIAKNVSHGESAASIKGTPSSIAPEVFLGLGAYTASVDLYSLGMVLYRLLNHGRNPFEPAAPAVCSDAQVQEAFSRRLRNEIPPLPAVGGELLGRAVVGALLDAQQRYQSAEDFAQAIRLAAERCDEATLGTSVRAGDPRPVKVRQQISMNYVSQQGGAGSGSGSAGSIYGGTGVQVGNGTMDINSVGGASGASALGGGYGYSGAQGPGMTGQQGGMTSGPGYYGTGASGAGQVAGPAGGAVTTQGGQHYVEPGPKGSPLRNVYIGVGAFALAAIVGLVVWRFVLSPAGSTGSSGDGGAQTTSEGSDAGGVSDPADTESGDSSLVGASSRPSDFPNPYHGDYGLWTDGEYVSDSLDLRIIPKGVVQPYYAESSDDYPDFVYAWDYDEVGWAIAELLTAPELDGLDPASLKSTVDGSALEAVQLGGSTWYRNTYETDDGWHTELYHSVAGKMLAIHIIDPTYGAYTKLFLDQCSFAIGVPDAG